jgi:signal peptidase I
MKPRLIVRIVAFTVLAAACSTSTHTLSYTVPSESMVPTLKVGQVIKVRPISSDNRVDQRDIIVFKAPPDSDPGIDDLVKRVVGLPGETVAARGAHVYIDGKQLAEPYLPAGTITSDFAPVKIPAGSYWVLGDNRGNSKDSRVFGVIGKDKIVGIVKPS